MLNIDMLGKHMLLSAAFCCDIMKNKDARRGQVFLYVSLKCSVKVYNLSFYVACMILLTILFVIVLLPGNLLKVVIIFASAFHLCCKFLAKL